MQTVNISATATITITTPCGECRGAGVLGKVAGDGGLGNIIDCFACDGEGAIELHVTLSELADIIAAATLDKLRPYIANALNSHVGDYHWREA